MNSQNPQRSAFTLIESIIATAMLAAVMLMVTQSLDSSTQLNDRTTRTADLNGRANDVINKLSLQLRLAAAGKSTLIPPVPSMLLPGPYPANFTPADPAGVSKVKAFYYTVSTGISDGAAPTPWAPTYEPFQRVLIYDYSRDPGRLLLRRFTDTGVIAQEELLTEQVAANGFDITRAGNTVALSLTLRTVNRQQEDIIYTAKAQTIFLRSTMSMSSGASPISHISDPTDMDLLNNTTFKTQSTPSLLFGNMITLVETGKKQISLLVVAPIGERLVAKSMIIELADYTTGMAGTYVTIEEGATKTVNGCTVTRATQPGPAQWPSPNGTYILTLTGVITSVSVRVTAETESGKIITDYRNY